MGNTLFRRFFIRFAGGLGIASFVFLALVHAFQVRVIDTEWREELRQEAVWLGRHSSLASAPMLASAWKTMHSAVRVTYFDADGEVVADSHPERDGIDLPALEGGREPPGQLAVTVDMAGGGRLVMSRPYVPAFPFGLNWELGVAVLLILGPMTLLLYPLARSMSKTLRDMGAMAQEVSAGHFGKTLPVTRTDELGDLVRSLNDMSQRLAEAERLNSRLLQDVSHELRSPMGRIQVLAETIGRRPEERDVCVRGIEQEVALLDRLVDDLLQVARLESKQRGARQETFSLLHWLGETLPRFELSARAKGIEWRSRLPEDDREVHGDPQQLAQALANLVDNAIRALQGQEAAAIEVLVALDGESWSLTVADNGPGISEEHLAHVFRRFYRVDEHRSREAGGVGLGLSLVRAIAQAHGGDAAIESRVGNGTRVTVTVPL